MAEALAARRIGLLDGRSVNRANVSLSVAAPARRISLRARPEGVAALSAALGVPLPREPKQSATSGTRSALWLGPDEWLVIEEGEADLVAEAASAGVLHSAVDVSHRNTAILVLGVAAADVINAGCPQDLSLKAFAVGACSRTLVGKVEIVLWRLAEDEFRVECWRSFSDYAFTYLAEAARG